MAEVCIRDLTRLLSGAGGLKKVRSGDLAGDPMRVQKYGSDLTGRKRAIATIGVGQGIATLVERA